MWLRARVPALSPVPATGHKATCQGILALVYDLAGEYNRTDALVYRVAQSVLFVTPARRRHLCLFWAQAHSILRAP